MNDSKKSFFATRTRRVQYILATIIFIASLSISVYVMNQNEKQEHDEFVLLSQQITQLVNDRMDYYTQLLLGGLGLFEASEDVTKNEWKNFSDAQMLDSKFLGVQGIGYSKVMHPDELHNHTTTRQQKGVNNRELYTSIIYLEPFNERNKRAFGYDMYSQETRREAMQRAIETGEPSLSGKVRLLQENGINEQAGFLLYLPLYKKNMPLRNKKQRYGAIEGFVYAPFRVKNLFENISKNLTKTIGVEIYDGKTLEESALLLRSFKPNKTTTKRLKYTTTLTIAGKVWTLQFTKLHQVTDINDITPLLVLASGIFITFLVFLLLDSLTKFEKRQRYYLEELHSLSFKQSLALKAANMGMWEVNYETDKHTWDAKMYELFDIYESHSNNLLELWDAKLFENEKDSQKQKLLDALNNKTEYDAKFWIQHRNGEKRYIHTMALCEFNTQKKAIRMVGTCMDITEQKVLEMQLHNKQEAILQVKTAGFIHLREHKFIWTNTAFDEMLGYKKGELQGKHISDVIENESLYSTYKEKISTALNQSGSFSGEISAKRKDGSTSTLLVSITRLKDTLNESMVVVMDISLQKKLEKNLQDEVIQKTNENLKQLKILQNQNKLASMGEMIGAIAHQWRQPLNELSIRIQNIQYVYDLNKLDSAYIEDFITKNTKTIDFMSKTIENFRNFFRTDKEESDFSIKEALDEILNMQSSQLENYNITTELIGEDFVQYGHKTELQQVILNLLSNAKDALVDKKVKEPKITLKLLRKTIIIQDNAGGISEDIIDRVFEPYFTTKEQGKGTGMGLYMSKMIIEENLYGSLQLQNKNGGLEVTIEFPL